MNNIIQIRSGSRNNLQPNKNDQTSISKNSTNTVTDLIQETDSSWTGWAYSKVPSKGAIVSFIWETNVFFILTSFFNGAVFGLR